MAILDRLFTKNESDKTIVSFDIITLRESGMRYTCEYEIVMKDGKAEVSQYEIRYNRSEVRRALVRRAVCSADTVLKLLNDCRFISWNGFNGPHPKGVLDGIMFSLKATVNDGKRITAEGSQNFPKHYRDFTHGLNNILEDSGYETDTE